MRCLPTLGGQTGLNVAMDLSRHGVLEKFGVEMIGANADVIDKAESRERFQAGDAEHRPRSARGQDGAAASKRPRDWLGEIGLPAVRAAELHDGRQRLGDRVRRRASSIDSCSAGSSMSPVHQVLIEESIIGWKEYEMEVMRDKDDNVVIICSIENFDPMGIHTGDSITVAPAQTLTDKEYQRMRDASLAVIREIGVETGGSNIQFAIHPGTGRMIVIEMNPRVSRSSALASKATGFPIAKIAAKLAVGYRLHELPNDITRETTACFEPTIDYVVTKVPRFAFEKFPEADATLTTQMKSVGETMAIGSTFKESFQKALRGLEVRSDGFGCDRLDLWGTRRAAERGGDRREAQEARRRAGLVSALRVQERHERGEGVRADGDRSVVPRQPARDCRDGGSAAAERRREVCEGRRSASCCARPSGKDFPIASLRASSATSEIGGAQASGCGCGIRATFKSVDTCAAEFEAYTPYYYSTYEDEDEVPAKQPGEEADHHSRRRAEPDRAGDRVRLLLLPCKLRAQGAGHRVGDGQLESGDGEHRLRHERHAVLRAADGRGRAQHLRSRAAGRRDRAVRRADAAEPGAAAEGCGRADHRHERRCDRGGRGSREVSAAAPQAGPAAAAERHCPHDGRGAARGGEDRLSAARAAELRAGRPGDGDLLRRRRRSSGSWPRRSSWPRGSRC